MLYLFRQSSKENYRYVPVRRSILRLGRFFQSLSNVVLWYCCCTCSTGRQCWGCLTYEKGTLSLLKSYKCCAVLLLYIFRRVAVTESTESLIGDWTREDRPDVGGIAGWHGTATFVSETTLRHAERFRGKRSFHRVALRGIHCRSLILKTAAYYSRRIRIGDLGISFATRDYGSRQSLTPLFPLFFGESAECPRCLFRRSSLIALPPIKNSDLH